MADVHIPTQFVGRSFFSVVDARLCTLQIKNGTTFAVSVVQEPVALALGSFRASQLVTSTGSRASQFTTLLNAFIAAFQDPSRMELQLEDETVTSNSLAARSNLGGPGDLKEGRPASSSRLSATTASADADPASRSASPTGKLRSNAEFGRLKGNIVLKVTMCVGGQHDVDVTLKLWRCPEVSKDPFVWNLMIDMFRTYAATQRKLDAAQRTIRRTNGNSPSVSTQRQPKVAPSSSEVGSVSPERKEAAATSSRRTPLRPHGRHSSQNFRQRTKPPSWSLTHTSQGLKLRHQSPFGDPIPALSLSEEGEKSTQTRYSHSLPPTMLCANPFDAEADPDLTLTSGIVQGTRERPQSARTKAASVVPPDEVFEAAARARKRVFALRKGNQPSSVPDYMQGFSASALLASHHQVAQQPQTSRPTDSTTISEAVPSKDQDGDATSVRASPPPHTGVAMKPTPPPSAIQNFRLAASSANEETEAVHNPSKKPPTAVSIPSERSGSRLSSSSSAPNSATSRSNSATPGRTKQQQHRSSSSSVPSAAVVPTGSSNPFTPLSYLTHHHSTTPTSTGGTTPPPVVNALGLAVSSSAGGSSRDVDDVDDGEIAGF